MAVDPRISLALNPGKDVQSTFNNALLNIQGVNTVKQLPVQNRILEAQSTQAESSVDRQRTLDKFTSLAFGASELLPSLQLGDLSSAGRILQNRRAALIQEGKPTETTDEAINLLQTNPAELLAGVNETIRVARQQGILKTAGGLASAKTEILPDGAVIQALPNGEVQVRNPQGQIVTGEARSSALSQSQNFALQQQTDEANIAVTKAQNIARVGARESRVSDMKRDFGDRNRASARGQVRLRQALKLAGSATQGTAGSLKLQLAKIFPNIDVTNEAMLDQTLGQLTIDELQKFKGPTTDFEFEKAQKTVGGIGDSKTANIARLKSLQRAGWFQQREVKQFNEHTKSGGDPDGFSFNFGEPVKTKKGMFTLRDIQDTAVANNLSIEETLKRLNE